MTIVPKQLDHVIDGVAGIDIDLTPANPEFLKCRSIYAWLRIDSQDSYPPVDVLYPEPRYFRGTWLLKYGDIAIDWGEIEFTNQQLWQIDNIYSWLIAELNDGFDRATDVAIAVRESLPFPAIPVKTPGAFLSQSSIQIDSLSLKFPFLTYGTLSVFYETDDAVPVLAAPPIDGVFENEWT